MPPLVHLIPWIAQITDTGIDLSKVPAGWPMWVLLVISLGGHILRPLGQAKLLLETLAANTTATREAVQSLAGIQVRIGEVQSQLAETQRQLAMVLGDVQRHARELDDTAARLERQVEEMRPRRRMADADG